MRNTGLTTYPLNFLKKITHHLTTITHNRIKTIKIKNNNHKPTTEESKQDQSSQNITIIKETSISQQPENEDNKLDFLSPPVISKTFTSATPVTIDTSTPAVNENQTKPKMYNKDIINPKLYKKGKIIKQEVIQENALKMTQKLAKINYKDTGFFSNATADEKNKIMALSMYYQIGRFDPSNKFIVNCRKKDIINLVKQYTIEKLHKTNALIKICMYIHAIEERMEIDKINKDSIKNKNKHKN